MAKFKNDKGLTLIELLITIAVLAVVSAIALPVINNVVASSNSNALQQTIKDAQSFINKYSKSGIVAYDGLTKTFRGYIDTDGDNQVDSNELIDTLTLDAKFSVTANGTSPSIGGSYSNGGVTGVTITTSTGGELTIQPVFFTLDTSGMVMSGAGSGASYVWGSTNYGDPATVLQVWTRPDGSKAYSYYSESSLSWSLDTVNNGSIVSRVVNPDNSVTVQYSWSGPGIYDTIQFYLLDADPTVTPGASILPINLP